MRQMLDAIGKFCARVVTVTLYPIAISAWAIEVVIRKFKPKWEFETYSATPYMVAMVALSTHLIYSSTAWEILMY